MKAIIKKKEVSVQKRIIVGFLFGFVTSQECPIRISFGLDKWKGSLILLASTNCLGEQSDQLIPLLQTTYSSSEPIITLYSSFLCRKFLK